MYNSWKVFRFRVQGKSGCGSIWQQAQMQTCTTAGKYFVFEFKEKVDVVVFGNRLRGKQTQLESISYFLISDFRPRGTLLFHSKATVLCSYGLATRKTNP
ncbi:hypothetical protein M413DRAFT_198196 [Hebeloma cylindrosporum]|uniref:Uncharacterized protein n=1 Tax=Hebeloma cylindrosporum TaxID=76867 RepID=A0A0C3BRP7_HEBCY|nr:hypothetical protein M413DRAFT_198196 [Hebeloma cylindrosporum h7]